MNGGENYADDYVQDFVLDSFDNLSIKSELNSNAGAEDCNGGGCSNNNHNTDNDNNNRDEIQHPNHPSHVLTALPSLATSQLARLPPIPIPPMQSPPDNHENYHGLLTPHQLHPVMHGAGVVSMKSGNLIMYSNIPGTPPLTPPVSNSPSPQSGYQLDHQHQQYPHIHQVAKNAATGAGSTTGYMDDVLWLSHHQSVDYRPRQEPLDLRNGDAVTEVQNWNVTQQHTSVITAGNCKRIFQADYVHHHHRHQLVAPNQPYFNPLSSTSLISPASSSSRTTSSSSSVRTPIRHNGLASELVARNGEEPFISDEELVTLPVRDLNLKLKGSPKDIQNKFKQKRRTLKNRGYARNCRFKRVHKTSELEAQNNSLHAALRSQGEKLTQADTRCNSLQAELDALRMENTALRSQIQMLTQDLKEYQRKFQLLRSNPASNVMSVSDYC